MKNLEILNERERIIVSMHLGYGYEKHSYSDIAAKIGVSTSRVGQIVKKALNKIERCSTREGEKRDQYFGCLNLSTHAFNCIKRGRINTVGELVDLITENPQKFRNIRGLGEYTEREIIDKVNEFLGLNININIEN